METHRFDLRSAREQQLVEEADVGHDAKTGFEAIDFEHLKHESLGLVN